MYYYFIKGGNENEKKYLDDGVGRIDIGNNGMR